MRGRRLAGGNHVVMTIDAVIANRNVFMKQSGRKGVEVAGMAHRTIIARGYMIA